MNGFPVSEPSIIDILCHHVTLPEPDWEVAATVAAMSQAYDAYYEFELRLLHECDRIVDLVQANRYVDLLEAEEIFDRLTEVVGYDKVRKHLQLAYSADIETEVKMFLEFVQVQECDWILSYVSFGRPSVQPTAPAQKPSISFVGQEPTDDPDTWPEDFDRAVVASLAVFAASHHHEVRVH